MARIGAAGLDALEGRHAVRERRPDRFLEEGEIDLEIIAVGVGLGRRRGAAKIHLALARRLAFGAGVDAGRVDEERAGGHLVTAGEAEDEALLLMHRKLGADERGDLAPARGAGAIDEGAASDARAVRERRPP